MQCARTDCVLCFGSDLACMVVSPTSTQLLGQQAEVSVHELGAALAADLQHVFPDLNSPSAQHSLLAGMVFQFPDADIDLTSASQGGTVAPEVSRHMLSCKSRIAAPGRYATEVCPDLTAGQSAYGQDARYIPAVGKRDAEPTQFSRLLG